MRFATPHLFACTGCRTVGGAVRLHSGFGHRAEQSRCDLPLCTFLHTLIVTLEVVASVPALALVTVLSNPDALCHSAPFRMP